MEGTTDWLLINSASGSFSQDALERLKDTFAQAGRPLARVVAFPDHPAPDRAPLEAAGVNMLAIYTGDGTINGVVTGLYGWAGQVLVLPGGTQNLLAKALHGGSSAEAIVAALGTGALTPTRRHLVRCSAGDGLCEVLAGPGAHWSDVREAMRERDLGGVAATLGQALGKSTGGAAVHVVEPALGKAEGYPAVRLHPGDGTIAVDGYGAETLGEYAQQGLALLRRDFREGPHDELGGHAAVTCRSEERIALMIDGERFEGNQEERFTTHQCPVEFLASSGQPAGR